MKPIIHHPQASRAIIRGELHPPSDLALLTQDMLEIELPGGVFIDVGWYPEHDPAGHYAVLVFQDDDENPLREPYCTRDFTDLTTTVQKLAAEHLHSPRLVLASTETTATQVPASEKPG